MIIFIPQREAVIIRRAKPDWLLPSFFVLDATDTDTKDSMLDTASDGG